MTYQLLQNKHKLSADLMIADTLSQNITNFDGKL